jgi:glycosyltransferase involved in cell wall biosynthesis
LSSLKILHLLRSPRAEGTVKLALDWLLEPGVEQDVFVIHPKPAEMTEALRARAAWYGEGRGLSGSTAKCPWLVFKVWRVCTQRRPDIVICWSNGLAPRVLLGARLAGVSKLITHAGNPPNWTARGKIHTMISTFVAWLTGGRMVCCSHYVRDEFARSPGASASVLRVVYNCAPVARIRDEAARARAQRTDRRPRLIMVATLELHKDHATLLKAMPTVVRAVPGVQLWLAGDGSQRLHLESLSAALGLTDAVIFLGSRRDVPALLGQSDVFVFSTTREEGLGTVLIEALAAELPVVASDVPACHETLAGGRWGTLVPPADPEALAAAVIASLQSPATIETNGRIGYLQQFTPAGMIAAYVAATS